MNSPLMYVVGWSILLSWDGLLPIALFLIAAALRSVLANHPPLFEFSLIGLAVTVFFVRLRIGVSQIRSNNCGPILRNLQFIVFMICMFLWALLEFILMLVPRNLLFANESDLHVWLFLFLVYLAGMTFVWYPGRTHIQPKT